MNGLKSSWTEQAIWIFNILIIEKFHVSFSGAMEELSVRDLGTARGGAHSPGAWIVCGAVHGWTVLQHDN